MAKNSPICDIEELIKNLHEKACKEGKDNYVDPVTGLLVFTRDFHLRRGYCCGSGCRYGTYFHTIQVLNSLSSHCPYNHVNVKKKTKKL